jgi:hypothetical protein
MSYVSFAYSQDFWEQLYFPDSVHIKCLATNNQGHIFVGVGYDNEIGGVYRSMNNAQTWELVLDNAQHGVYSIAINEDGNIYVGKNGFVPFVVSYNNGDAWEEIALPGDGNMMEIRCSGPDTIYVSRWQVEGAFISFSFNGGETWDYSYVTNHHNEYVSDIELSRTGEIFVSTSGSFFDQGGVYKSVMMLGQVGNMSDY